MKRVLIGASIGIASAVTVPGVAQAADPVATKAEATTLDKVVVTAQRREESAQDVGVAISVISGETLAERGITKINELQNQTPSLEIEPAFGGGQPQFRLRGVGFQDYASNNSSPVGVYVGDVALSLPVQTQGQLFDIERVEILRGPQGTLYGRNTTGGAINFIPAKPTREKTFGITTSYGSFGELIAEGYASGAINDAVRGRVSFATDQGGAWQRNRVTGQSLGDKDVKAIRGQLEVDASSKLNLLLSAHYGEDKSDSQGLSLFKPLVTRSGGAGSVVIPADSNSRNTGWSLRPAFAQEIGLAANAKPSKDNIGSGVSLTANLTLDSVKLTSITSQEHLSRKEYSDWDGTASREADEYFNTKANVFSQEIRLASAKPGRFNWVTGIYYSHEKLSDKFYSDFTDVYGFATKTAYSQKSDSLAIFGQSDFKLTDTLKLVTGLRHEDETRKLNNFSTTQISPAVAIFAGPANRSQKTEEVTGKLGLEYQLAKNSLLYTNVSRGVKSGGFTTYNTPNLDSIAAIKPEVLWAYEAGFKSDLARNLRLNGAIFHYDYTNQQVQSAIWWTAGGGSGIAGKIVNAPKSKIDGGELELQWEPLSDLKIAQAVGYKSGKYEEFNAFDIQASAAAGRAVYRNLAGSGLNFPKLSYGGSVSYAFVTGGYRLRAETDYSYHDKYNSWLGKDYNVKSYWLANARFIVAPVGSTWSVALWGKNIFNQKYDQTRNFFTNAQIASAGQPATYGVQLNYTY